MSNTWQPDGLGYRARIGVLTPNDDAVPELEFWAMAPEGVSVHVERVPLVDTRTFCKSTLTHHWSQQPSSMANDKLIHNKKCQEREAYNP